MVIRNKGLKLAAALAMLLGGCAVPESGVPKSVPADGPLIDAFVFLSADGPVRADAVFDLPDVPRRATRLILRSLENRPMSARVSCDGPARLLADGDNRFVRPGGTQPFDILPRREGSVRMILTPEVSHCEIDWGADRRMVLERTGLHAPALARLDRFQDTCRALRPDTGDRLAQVFYANTALAQTCAAPPGLVDFAADPLDALNARIEALIGQRIAPADLERGDPDMPIDFSRAPKLDLIVLSYLHIRADLSGHLTRRMIEYHAARGTQVRILTSAALMLDLERTYWEGFAARHPNVQMQYFTWAPQGFDPPGSLVNTQQRANHTKLFLTLSPEPGRSRFITGGRNLHDGFFFDEIFDVSGHPELRSYEEGNAKDLTWHTVYDDFEIVMRGDAAVEQVAAHFSRLWHRDSDGAVPVPMTRGGDVAALPQGRMARHFISYPWADGRALEAYYVAMIDAAGEEILAVSPFVYPPASIVAALKRAEARGVRVVLVLRINSVDPPGFFTTALNHAFLNEHGDRFESWNYEPEGYMMHGKLLVIDRRLSVVTSTNLNRRSFIHDTENGVTFLDRHMADRLAAVVANYIRGGEPITGRLPSSGLMRAASSLRSVWQYF